jgi:hypothetical protein
MMRVVPLSQRSKPGPIRVARDEAGGWMWESTGALTLRQGSYLTS